MTLETGTRLGPYEIVELLGKGGMGEVYRAKDTKLGREVAIKLKEVSADPERLARFDREAKVLASLNHNNNGVEKRVFGESWTEEEVVVVMDRVLRL